MTDKKHDGMVRGFTQASRSWYSKITLDDPNVLDRINAGFYSSDGGTAGEFEISWVKIAGDWVPRLRAFDDGWSALFNFGDLLGLMADIDGKNITPDGFVGLLLALGIQDMTRVDQGGQ